MRNLYVIYSLIFKAAWNGDKDMYERNGDNHTKLDIHQAVEAVLSPKFINDRVIAIKLDEYQNLIKGNQNYAE